MVVSVIDRMTEGIFEVGPNSETCISDNMQGKQDYAARPHGECRVRISDYRAAVLPNFRCPIATLDRTRNGRSGPRLTGIVGMPFFDWTNRSSATIYTWQHCLKQGPAHLTRV